MDWSVGLFDKGLICPEHDFPWSYYLLYCCTFVLRLPKGRSSYRDYLRDIGLTRIRPFFLLVLLGVSCYLILAFFQASTSWIYHLLHGLPLTWSVIGSSLDISRDLPPQSQSLLLSFPSIFEEVAFRGILLTVFLGKYSQRKSIVFSSLGFSLMHLLNLTNGMDTLWVLGQVPWSFIIGLFYGYVFVRTRSLLPSMIVHYLGNVFVGTLAGYIQAMAKVEIQVLYGVILTFGVVPITLMILWTRFYCRKWIPGSSLPSSPDEKKELRLGSPS